MTALYTITGLAKLKCCIDYLCLTNQGSNFTSHQDFSLPSHVHCHDVSYLSTSRTLSRDYDHSAGINYSTEIQQDMHKDYIEVID